LHRDTLFVVKTPTGKTTTLTEEASYSPSNGKLHEGVLTLVETLTGMLSLRGDTVFVVMTLTGKTITLVDEAWA
jgi:hypothetical protein